MEKNLRLNKGLSLLFVMITALLLSACGSGSNNNNDAPLVYDGISEPAVITDDNVETLASKSVGLGFLNDLLQVSNGITTKATTKDGATLKSKSSDKGPKYKIPGYSGIVLLRTYSNLLTNNGAIIDIPVLARLVNKEGFPNVSGSFEDDLICSIDPAANTMTFQGDLIFTNARNDSDLEDKGRRDPVTTG